MNLDRPRIRVDFNEMVNPSLVLLSQQDRVLLSDGTKINLSEGQRIFIYEYNSYGDGEQEYLYAEGIAELNDPISNGEWTRAAKWCCRINEQGIVNV